MFRHHWFKKLWLFAALCNFIACHSVKEQIVPGATPMQADGKALTSTGSNYEAAFSPDGQRIIFVSSDRKQHRYGQIYELDLKSRRERRITFQGSQAHWPQYTAKGDSILYASSTDE